MRRSLTPLTLAGLFAAACSTMPVHKDYKPSTDFSRLKTYVWVDARPRAGDNLADNDIMEARVRGAVDRRLTARGYRIVAPAEADFRLAYHYIVEKTGVATERVRTGFGLGVGRGVGFGGASVGIGSGAAERESQTLALDVLDAKDGALLWHGYVTKGYPRGSSPEKIDQDIADMVEAILREFPPKPRRQ